MRLRLIQIAFGVLLLVTAGPDTNVPRAAAATTATCPPRPAVTARTITKPRWVANAVVTEYYPIRESWFTGRPVAARGLPGRHRVDWLFGPHGVAMNGEGLGRDGRFYHFAGSYAIDWVNATGAVTRPCWNGHWTAGRPAWLALGWRNRQGHVTYPLQTGGWSNGRAARYVHPRVTLTYRQGRARPQPFWKTVAVDPRVIRRGSRVFIPAYCDSPAHGWFRALDTGGAIIGFHVDVYRAPPRTLELRSLRGQKILVVPPGTKPRRPARC